ncbi:MAG: trypsin-like serine protease [Ruminococcaceae bacterium]|nr:trypsin-like serine protease [Oscillospiraceae bacterium]
MSENLNENKIEQAEVLEESAVKLEEAEIEEPQEAFVEDSDSLETEQPETIYNPIVYSKIEKADYKPCGKGLKFFAAILALVVLLTGACVSGYFMGKNNTPGTSSLNLAAKPVKSDELTEAEVYEKVNKSVVGIVVYNSSGKGSQASGIVFSEDGYIITNDHIYSKIPAAKFKIYTYDGKEYDARYIAGDKVSDLAVLKVEGAKLSPAEFGNSDELFYGEHVVAIGRPNDSTEPSSITNGIISALNRRVQNTTNYSACLIQTNSEINPGSSGGALVNMFGQIVGVTSSKLASTEFEGIGYAIPTVIMKRVVDELISEGRVVSRAKLGITYSFVDSISTEVTDKKQTGLHIESVSEDSDLYGKLNKGDTITHINNMEITNDNDVLDIIDRSKAGDKIDITVITANGGTINITAVLKANYSESSYVIEESPLTESKDEQANSGGSFDFPFGE